MKKLKINSLTQLEMFITVAEEGSFAAAADIFDISAVAVSKQITALEKSLGVVLFLRSTRKLSITKIGKQLYEKSKEIIVNAEELNQLADFMQQKPSGKITILVNAAMYRYIMLPHLAEFIELYPEIRLDILIRNKIPTIQATNIDIIFGVALFWLQENNADLVASPLLKVRRVLVGSKNYFKKYGRPKSLADMSELNYLHDIRHNADSFCHFCQNNNIQLKNTNRTDSIQALISSVQADLGVALLADFMFETQINSGHVEILDDIYKEEPFQAYMLHEKMHYLPAKLEAFKSFFLEKYHKK